MLLSEQAIFSADAARRRFGWSQLGRLWRRRSCGRVVRIRARRRGLPASWGVTLDRQALLIFGRTSTAGRAGVATFSQRDVRGEVSGAPARYECQRRRRPSIGYADGRNKERGRVEDGNDAAIDARRRLPR